MIWWSTELGVRKVLGVLVGFNSLFSPEDDAL